jgi:hypothetical protein
MSRHTSASHIAAKDLQLAKLERQLRQVSDENADLWKAVESFERIVAGVRDAKAARLAEANKPPPAPEFRTCTRCGGALWPKHTSCLYRDRQCPMFGKEKA